MGTPGPGRKRQPHREMLTAEDDALNQIAREAEARLAAKRAARAEAREIRMKELERQQKEIYQVQKKYYGLDTKWGDIEQWMEDNERYSHRSRRNASASDEDERISVGSRGSVRGNYSSELGLVNSSLPSKSQTPTQNGNLRSLMSSDALPSRSSRASLFDESIYSGSRRYSAPSSRAPSEYSCYLGSGSRASSRASSARASPVVEERSEKDFIEKGARTATSLSAATLASLGGNSSRRGSGDTSISVDTEPSIREIKDLLAEAEEKYKKAMVSNAQLDNEKTNFMYQVDTLKDVLLELEEQLAESRRQYEEKSKELERQKYAQNVLQFQFNEVKETLQQREEMLTEIRQLQLKKESFVREISDLQETIDWKDKKIGALERQKEFFDCVRSERDDLRDEVAMLKEKLKKHGIILNSEVATNGETSNDVKNEGHLELCTKVTPETSPGLKTMEDVPLGKANEVEMKNENLEEVGKGAVLQITENKERKEETETQEVVKAVMEQKTLHHDENTKTKGTSAYDNDLLVTCANSRHEEQIPSATKCVSSTEIHGISELGESTHQPFVDEVGHFSDITNQHIKKQVISDTLQSEDNIIDQIWNGNSETQYETQTKIQSWDSERQQESSMGHERECNNEEFQDALDFVVSSHEQNKSNLLAVGGDEGSKELDVKEIENYNKSIKIVNEEPNMQAEIKNYCENAKNSERQHDEECFDLSCDKVVYDTKKEGSGMEEGSEHNIVQSWEVQNNSTLELEGVDSGILSNESLVQIEECKKIMVECNSQSSPEESKGGQVKVSISTGFFSQDKEDRNQLQTMRDINESKIETVERERTEAEIPVKHQCSHDIKNSILDKPAGESMNNILQVDEGETNKKSSMQDSCGLVKFEIENAETHMKMNQRLRSPSHQENAEKEKQDITITIQPEELDCVTKVHSKEVAEESFNFDDERGLQESGKQSMQLSKDMSWNLANHQATEIDSPFLEATDKSDQTARNNEMEEEISTAETETKTTEDRDQNQEVVGNRKLDNDDKNDKREMGDGVEAQTNARQLKENAEGHEREVLSHMEDDEMEDQKEEIVENDGEAFDFDDDTAQTEENSGKHLSDEVDMKEFGKAKELKLQQNDGDCIAIEEKGQDEKIENEEVLNKDQDNSQLIETKNSQGVKCFQEDTFQSCPGLADKTEEKTTDSNDTEETSGNPTKQLDDLHADVAKSESKDDIGKDDTADKGSRKGKGKNKEDCLVA
ncbi:leucine-rich repeat flightless-interacting protein 1 isoform X5 [Rhinatrema bivittatum]|uniref:leucine-rich repeat flightless-interacting protein 1 isoform X5 n=1 Tax=Rhinatrema bivittatum TaxID=194408 RepID=UPI00112CB8DF|nr:leucine-rich repeat flightless-interacting protein 1 isoform X5 [Rhinatrema bivittatum]